MLYWEGAKWASSTYSNFAYPSLLFCPISTIYASMYSSYSDSFLQTQSSDKCPTSLSHTYRSLARTEELYITNSSGTYQFIPIKWGYLHILFLSREDKRPLLRIGWDKGELCFHGSNGSREALCPGISGNGGAWCDWRMGVPSRYFSFGCQIATGLQAS